MNDPKRFDVSKQKSATFHLWGEETMDWEGLDKASDIVEWWLKLVRIPVTQIKEKYGSLQVYHHLGWYSIHDITHPGHHFIRYKKNGLLWRLNYAYKFNEYFFGYFLNPMLIYPLHRWMYRFAFKQAVKKYPHLWLEILVSNGHDGLLDGIAGFRHKKYWRSIEDDKEDSQEGKEG